MINVKYPLKSYTVEKNFLKYIFSDQIWNNRTTKNNVSIFHRHNFQKKFEWRVITLAKNIETNVTTNGCFLARSWNKNSKTPYL